MIILVGYTPVSRFTSSQVKVDVRLGVWGNDELE